MSGIAGWIDFFDSLPYGISEAEVMTETISHRGEAVREVKMTENTVFAYCAKKDEAPFAKDEQNGSMIVFDGELYNQKELIYELEHLGHKFLDKTDSEVVLKSYKQWEKSCMSRLNGSFAFVVLDKEKNTLFSARDRFGTKPLYYRCAKGSFAFASEIKALLSLPDTTPSVSAGGIASLLGLWSVKMPGSAVFREIESIKPAHFLSVSEKNTTQRLYWEPQNDEHRENLSNTAEKVRYHVRESVSRRLGRHRDECVVLSGDLSSAIICALGANQYAFEKGERLSTYSFEYKDTVKPFTRGAMHLNADKMWISRMCDEFSTRHRVIFSDAEEIAELISKSVTALDLPGATKEDIFFLSCVSQLTKKHKNAAVGDGADDLFGSREWFSSGECFEYECFPWLKGKDRLTDFLNEDMLFFLNSDTFISKKYKESVQKTPRFNNENEFEARRRELFYLNRTLYLPYILEKKSAIAESTGLSLCMPFCDGALAEYVWNIPWNIKAPAGTDKGVLRLAMKGIVPDDVNDRNLNNHPTEHTPALDSKIKELALQILTDSKEPISDFTDIKKIAEAIHSNTISTDSLLYLIEFNIWLREYGIIIK